MFLNNCVLQMGDSEKMGEEERDQKILEFFRAVFKTHDSDKAGTDLFLILKSKPKQMLKLIYETNTVVVILSYEKAPLELMWWRRFLLNWEDQQTRPLWTVC